MSRIFPDARGWIALGWIAGGLGLVAVSAVSGALPLPWAFAWLPLGVAGTVMFVIGVGVRQWRAWLGILAGLACLASVIASIAIGPFLLRTHGHIEQCAVANVAEVTIFDGNGFPYYTNHWAVSCPDGTHEFDLPTDVEPRASGGAVPMVVIPGGLIEAEPLTQVPDVVTLVAFAAPPFAALLVVVLLTAVLPPLSPSDEEP